MRRRVFVLGAAVLACAFVLPACNPLTGLVSVDTGSGFTCAVRDVGTVSCWGRNDSGQLGDGTTVNSENPVDVAGVTDAVAVSSGGRHACAVLGDATLRCWGDNDYGQLGLGSTSDWGDVSGEWPASGGAVSLPAGTTATAVSAGGYFTCVILSTGALDAARAAAHAEAQRALDAAATLPSNSHREALLQLAAALLERRS